MKKSVYFSSDFERQIREDVSDEYSYVAQYFFGDQNKKGFYNVGMDTRNDDTRDLRTYQALEFDVTCDDFAEIIVEVVFGQDSACFVETNIGRGRGSAFWKTKINLNGTTHITADFRDFNDQVTRCGAWRFVKGFCIYCNRKIKIDQLQVSKGIPFYLKSDIYSKSAKTGETITYLLELGNCTNQNQTITISWKKYGWESLDVKFSDCMILEPYQVETIPITVTMNEFIAPGGFERHTITAIPNGNGLLRKECTFISQKYLEHPYIIATDSVYLNTLKKIQDQDWAKKEYHQLLKLADEFIVPEIDESKPYLFITETAHLAQKTAIAWKLTHKREYLEKVVLFLARLTNESNGYLTNLCACHQELVHEGEFFQSTAIAYDIVCNSGLLTKDDHRRIENTFRRFIKLIDFALQDGNISNWALCELTGALFCSLALQDRERAERFLFGIGGMKEQIGVGVLDDGWWYEVSIGYNQLAAGLFSKMHIAMEPWGINLKDMWFPPAYTKEINKKNGSIDGLVIEAWGPRTKNYRNLEMQWDSMVPFSDERGVIFGLSDSAESKLAGVAIVDPRYDAAYHLFHKNTYAKAVKNSNEERDLLYGAAQLPETIEKKISSCYADNAGIVWLRSQKPGRELKDQIAVSVKYGCHGGAHGHYDRTAMNSVMRYGRSMYNPENVWHGYKTFLYKFYLQNSITHNMVTVDLKQQDPNEARCLLFYSGEHMQACVVENVTRWCNPPYGGWKVYEEKTYSERAWNEGRYVRIPKQEPPYTRRSDFTEPVMQRRATVVTNDYIINLDFMKGGQEHDYHCIYHIRGLKEIEGASLSGRRELLDESPLSAGQFITDVSTYHYNQGNRAAFTTIFKEVGEEEKLLNPDRTLYNEEGVLNMDVYAVYPRKGEIICAHLPESYHVAKQLFYEVTGDNKILAKGKFGAWVLGRDEIDIHIENVHQLSLKVHVNSVMGEYWSNIIPLKTIFWGDPYFIMEDGQIFYLSKCIEDSFAVSTSNLDFGNGIGKDYYGGCVKIQAKQYDKAVPAEPVNKMDDSIISISIDSIIQRTGKKPIRFCSAVGGDYPVGDEKQNRMFYAVRQRGRVARFITVLEPFEKKKMICNIYAVSKDEIQVTLSDGREHNIKIKGLEEEDSKIEIHFTEYENGMCKLREEAKGHSL